MRYLVTGHTGFKGSWLSVLLKMQGHEVYGISLPPLAKSHYNQSDVSDFLNGNYYLDIRDKNQLHKLLENIKPEVVIHLAAQPLVNASYENPIDTYETNVIGTLNILDAIQNIDTVKTSLIITTDKVYKNKNKLTGYVEEDVLGGDDPYSSSKASADLATQSWRASFGKKPIGIARAGNVIGGGDWALDRLVPDLVNALETANLVIIRNPHAVRPWQHVLDCLNGYIKLIDYQLLTGNGSEWNFGPKENEFRNVETLINDFSKFWGQELVIKHVKSEIKEAELLVLNSDKSRKKLNWSEKLTYDETLIWTVNWYKEIDKKAATLGQIRKYLEL